MITADRGFIQYLGPDFGFWLLGSSDRGSQRSPGNLTFYLSRAGCHQINLLAKGLKFIPTPKQKEIQIRRHLLKDFDQFTRRMRLQYIYHGENNEPHPFHVKSGWIPPVQQSVALESYLEETRVLLAEVQLSKPKNNLSHNEQRDLKMLTENTEINLNKADKGARTVVLKAAEKILEGQVQLDNIEHYRTLLRPMVKDTSLRVQILVKELYQQNRIDDMTNKWLCLTPTPPRVPVFYTLTKIRKPTPVGRPIIGSLCKDDGNGSENVTWK